MLSLLPEITCPELSTPRNGHKSSNDMVVETVVTFGCSLGYNMTGSSVLECQEGGNWNGTTPTCKGICVNTNELLIIFFSVET